MDAHAILSAYDTHLTELQTVFDEKAWERLDDVLSGIDALQRQFDQLPPSMKQGKDIQDKLQRLLERHQQLTQQLLEAKQQVETNIRNIKTAQVHRQGYSQIEQAYIPAAFYDQKK